MNSNPAINRIEILFYSALISVMSGVNRLRAKNDAVDDTPDYAFTGSEPITSEVIDSTPQNFSANFWTRMSQAILSFLIWMVLGFAAGFLIGMINPR